jgi:alcohol dehydrogenase (NADP+)
LSGSIIGAMSPTQLILDDCRQQNFTADMEITPIKKINEAPDQLFK